MTTAQVCPVIFCLIFFNFSSQDLLWALMNLFFLGCFVKTCFTNNYPEGVEEITLYKHDWSAYHCKLKSVGKRKRDRSEGKKEATHLFWDLTDDQQLKPNIFVFNLFLKIFLQNIFEEKSDQRPRIPLKPMLPPLLLLYRYLSNWRRRSWKLIFNL